MNTADGKHPGNILVELRTLYGMRPSTEVAQRLKDIFSNFGRVRGVSNLEIGHQCDVFLIDFVLETHAMRAANVTGLKLFGFTTLIVDLEKFRPGLSGA